MIARSIKRRNDEEIEIIWDDHHSSIYTLHLLRDVCPCAECKGESILLHSIPPAQHPHQPGRYSLLGMHPVGNYAVQITWGDAHDTGIYSWEYLRSLCHCETCGKL